MIQPFYLKISKLKKLPYLSQGDTHKDPHTNAICNKEKK